MSASITLPPHDEQAERAVLGSVMIDPDCIPAVSAILRPDDFYIVKHGWIFGAALELQRSGDAVDLLTVGAALERAGKLEDVGGEGYIAGLLVDVATALNVETYARTVAKYAQRRRLLIAASTIAKDAQDLAVDDDSLPGGALAAVTAATDHGYKPARNMGEVMEMALADFDRRRASPGPNGPTFGISDLDRMIGGLEPGRLYFVAGRPGAGKSVLMAQAAMRCARSGKPAALFTLEMGEPEMLARMAKAHAGIGYAPGGEAKLTDDQAAGLRRAYADVAGWPLTIRADLSRLSQILAECERLALRGVALAVIDYLQIAVIDAGKRDVGTRDAELSAATRQLKALAMRLQIPVLVGSQLNRQADGVRPTLAMMRESGGIESDADAIVALWTPDQTQPAATEAAVIKNRSGETGAAQLYFDKPAHRLAAGVVVKV